METNRDKKHDEDRKLERQRQLNVIYFVDASKTHSFRLPLKTGILAGGVLGLILLWSFVGSIMLLREAVVANNQGQRIQALLDTVFQYQTRYDDVYEKAYPKGINDRKNQRVAQEEPPMEGDNPATQENEAEIALAAKTPPRKAEQPPPEDPNDKAHVNFAVEIAEIKITQKPNLLQVSFNMRNNRKPDLSSGTLWGIATYQNDGNGAKRYITAPMGVQITEDGETANFRGGYRFSIRYFNSRTLTFPTPQAEGSFKLLRVFLADEKNRQMYVTVPLQLSKEQNEQSVALPPHLEYHPPIRPATTVAAPAEPAPTREPKARPIQAKAPSEPKKNLTVPEQKPDNGGKFEEQNQEPSDTDPNKSSLPQGEPSASPAAETEEERPVESVPTIIDDGPSE